MIPIYIVTGLLESGKTTFIKETLMTQEWIEPGITLLLSCEEGEEEYSKEFLEYNDIVKLDIEKEDYNLIVLNKVTEQYEPSQVIIEFNGMWDFEAFMNVSLPENWGIAGIYTMMNGATLDSYLKNMRNLVMEQANESELIIVNRCTDKFNRGSFKRAITVQNPMAQIIFERPDGTIITPTEEDLPFDTKTNKIWFNDSDYGIWYVDAFDHPDRYEGKEITFLAQAFRPQGMEKHMFVPGRLIMTCCANDIQFYGYPCKCDRSLSFNKGDWVKVTVMFGRGFQTPDGSERPLLTLLKIESAKKPAQEVVMLN